MPKILVIVVTFDANLSILIIVATYVSIYFLCERHRNVETSFGGGMVYYIANNESLGISVTLSLLCLQLKLFVHNFWDLPPTHSIPRRFSFLYFSSNERDKTFHKYIL